MKNIEFELIVCLEIHVELSTKSKMFCQCSADWFEKKPNTNVCPVCLGLPGALPVPNKMAIEKTLKLATALNCHINKYSKFDRKNYFYPDLPKGYQISQYDQPLALGGEVKVALFSLNIPDKSFQLTRIHLEEDTGKLMHKDKKTVIDFNRSGVPLMEIVTEPVFRSSSEVKLFLEELHATIRALSISDANMEKGSMRLEPNISLRPIGTDKFLPYKVEVKNINSFNFVKKAIDFEYDRQLKILKSGEIPLQETRGWNEKISETFSQRSKETASDYRYFPEPDIPPLLISSEWLNDIKLSIIDTPYKSYSKLKNNFNLKDADAFLLSRNNDLYLKYENICEELSKNKANISPQFIANLFLNKKIDLKKSISDVITEILQLSQTISFDENELVNEVKKVIENNEKIVAEYKSGKVNLLMYLVGIIMRTYPKKFPPEFVKSEFIKQLN